MAAAPPSLPLTVIEKLLRNYLYGRGITHFSDDLTEVCKALYVMGTQRLPGFRFHDLRHCAITSLAESGAADSTIMALAGHVNRKMLERYSHVRMEAKRTAMETLANSGKMAGYDTNAPPLNVRPS